jgi:hypothetical protein
LRSKDSGVDSLSAGLSNAERTASMVKRKKVFLSAYEEWGTTRAACKAAGITRSAYNRWHSSDDVFAKDLDLVKLAFAESLEEEALTRIRNPDKGRGSDLLLITLMNANMAWKYRPQLAMSEDSAKELIVEWRRAARDVGRSPRPTRDENGAELPTSVEQTLSEILERRGNAVKEGKVEEGGEQGRQDAPA